MYWINQTIFSNSLQRNRNIGIAVIVITLLIIGLAGSSYFNQTLSTQTPNEKPTSNPIHFDYNLTISPTNNTIMQGNDVQIIIIITYLQGSPENVTLSAIGIPNNADYTFNPREGFPTSNTTFNSTLTIHVSSVVPTKSYNITISSVADDGMVYSSSYTLSVIRSVVNVSETMSAGTGKISTEIIFEQLSASGATVQTFTAPVYSGHYSIDVPNKQFYAVSDVWTSSNGSSGIHHFIFPYGVFADEGVTSITCSFSWGT